VEFTPDQINDINTNLLLGTSYLNMVLGNLDGSQPLATAAYNAGPGRPRSWRSTLARPVEGAIFANRFVYRNAWLRQERDVERHLLRRVVRGQAAITQTAIGPGCSACEYAD